jgi:hypothetical protein
LKPKDKISFLESRDEIPRSISEPVLVAKSKMEAAERLAEAQGVEGKLAAEVTQERPSRSTPKPSLRARGWIARTVFRILQEVKNQVEWEARCLESVLSRLWSDRNSV